MSTKGKKSSTKKSTPRESGKKGKGDAESVSSEHASVKEVEEKTGAIRPEEQPSPFETTFPAKLPDFYEFELQKQLENIEIALRRTRDAHATQRQIADTYGYDADSINLLQDLVSKMIALENDRLHVLNNIGLARAMGTVQPPPPMPQVNYYMPANTVSAPVAITNPEYGAAASVRAPFVPNTTPLYATNLCTYEPSLEAARQSLFSNESVLVQRRQEAFAAAQNSHRVAMDEQRAIEAARLAQAELMRAQARAQEAARIANEFVQRSHAQRTYSQQAYTGLFQAEATVQKHRHEMALTEYQHRVNQYHRRQQIAAQTAALNNTLGSHSYLGTAGTGKTNSYLPWPSRR